MEKKKIDGFEDSTYSLSDLPIITIGQPMSPAVMEGILRAGDLFNTVTKEKLGDLTSPIEIVVYKAWPSRTKFAPRGTKGSMMECSSPDGIRGAKGECKKCPFNNFQLRDRCTEQRSFIVALASAPGSLMRLIFSRSTIPQGRKLEKMLIAELNKSGKTVSYAHTMKLGVAKEKNDSTGAQYFVFTVDTGVLLPDDQIAEMESYAEEALELRKDNLAKFQERLEAGTPLEEGEPTEEGGGEDSPRSPDALV